MTSVDPQGHATRYDYDSLDRVTRVFYPDGTSETTDYTWGGLAGTTKDRAGRKSYYDYDYDALKRPVRMQDANGQTLQMDYDASGNLTRLMDAKGYFTRWEYDASDRAVEKLYHDGTSEGYAYSQGLLSQSRGARGQVVSYAYDANANLTGINYPNMPDVAMSYNTLDDVTQITDGVGTHSFSYDNLGKLLSLDGPFADDQQSFGYDSLQRLQSQSVGRGASGGTQSQSYAYDALGRLASLNSNGTQGVGAFTYNYQGVTDILTRLDLPNGTQTVQSYDGLQRLTQTVNQKTGGTDLNKFAYAYDTRDVRTGVQQQYGTDPLRQVNYTYDSVDQLKSETATGGAANTSYSNAFDYDAMGNRLKSDTTQGTNSSSVRSSVNTLNQVTALSSALNGGPRVTSGFDYDAAGNTTKIENSDGTKTLFAYDDADRLVRIETRNAADAPLSKSEFVYDYASRKAVSREFTYTGGTWVKTGEKRRVFDGLDVVQERNDQNEVTAQLVRDGNIGGILARSNAAGASFFGYDGGGNVTLLTDENGDDVGRYRYDAFGNTLEAVGSRAAENPYRFSTKELHAASGLYDFGFRFYSPGLGRWINRDPIAESGGVNLYGYVDNDPVNFFDPDGLKKEKKVGYIIVGNLSGDSWSAKNYAGYKESEIQQAKTWFYNRGYDKVYVVRGATPAQMKKLLRRKDTKGIWFFGHAFSNTGRLVMNGGGVSADDIKKWLGGRKLDDAVFHVCFAGSDRMKQITVGDKGYFWGTTNAYTPAAPTGVTPRFFADKINEQKRKQKKKKAE